MDIKIYNSLTRNKDAFKPIKNGEVSMYHCGPTVYDTAHIGNFRTFIFNDILRRVFEYNGYKVKQVMNITDVDDKTIKRSSDEGLKLAELTKKYEDIFIEELDSLNIKRPSFMPRARESVKEMIDMINTLLEKGFAYKASDGVYFKINKFENYSQLANLKLDREIKERISNDNYDKDNPQDFALWKFHTNESEEAVWDAPFGKGRPGWHIECSAMSKMILGDTIDIHTGGIDLIFPHHTNEIAQSECANGKRFVNYWVHGGFINVNDEKMAKSKGNFYKLNDIKEMGISPIGYRYWLLTSHYRSPVNFTLDAVKGAQTAFIRLIDSFLRLKEVKNEHIHAHGEMRDYRKEFIEKISDDFDMPQALAITWDMIKDHSIHAKEKVEMLLDFDKVFGFGLDKIMSMKKEIPVEIIALAEAREQARKDKEWEKSDALRIEIESRGYTIKDTSDGFELSENN
jgi:cysteinyl-tRNA synthetase